MADVARQPEACLVSLAAEPASAQAARRFTTTTLRSWGLDGLVHDGMMIASELVTNAIMHGAPEKKTRDTIVKAQVQVIAKAYFVK